MSGKIAFLGAGNMATPIINSITDRPVFIYDKISEVYKKFDAENITCVYSAAEAVKNADYIFLCSKPQQIEEVLTDIRTNMSFNDKVFVSIAAGTPISKILGFLQCNAPVIRTMPNTPMTIGKGVVAITRNELVSDDDFNIVCDIFKQTSEILVMPEEHIDAVTSVTASAPAYVYLFIKAILDSAVKQGLEYENMLQIVCNMVAGSAELLLHTGMTPDETIKIVASPKGTTEAALKVFDNSDFTDIIHNAMVACTERAAELSKL
jgi:pyrroline-5-carboxylate reductase